MHSRCLFCDKRLSIFHIGKPFCSDVHEDRYLEQQSRTGLDRLLGDSPPTAPQSPTPAQPAKGLPPPLAPELYAYPKADPEIIEDFSTSAESPQPPEQSPAEQSPNEWMPEPATYLVSSPNVVHGARPSFPVRDPNQAAFPPEIWTSNFAGELSLALLSFEAAHIVPAAVIFTPAEPANLEIPKAQAVPPVAITTLARLRISPLPIADTVAPREQLTIEPVIALPRLERMSRHYALIPVPGRTRQDPAQTRTRRSLPVPEPLRLRSLLHFHTAMFQPSRHGIAAAPLMPLLWNAEAPPLRLWQSKSLRRPIAPVVPTLDKTDVSNRAALQLAGGMEK